jgi:hypothetical protein
MNVSIRRRSVDCVSDLTIDRWLLGETPGSDEARELEVHMRHCAVCAARLGSLRNLYSNQPTDEVATTVMELAEAPRPAARESGVVQVIVMRDGLLVGTEYFTAGRWVIGSKPNADLSLGEGPSPAHALLVFHDGSVAVESREGPVFVNGVRLQRALVRPTDEVWIGPYALRTRVITERWSWPAMISAPARTVELPTVIERPLANDSHLHASLWWGASQVSVHRVDAVLSSEAVRGWGFEADVRARRLTDGTWAVNSARGELRLSMNEATSVEAGALRLVLSVQPRAATLPARRLEERRFPLILLAMFAVFAALAAMAPARGDEEDFLPRAIPPVHVTITPPAPKAAPAPASAPEVAPKAVAAKPTPKTIRRASPPPPRNRFEALDRITSSAIKVASALGRTGNAPKTKRAYGAVLPAMGTPSPLALGFGAPDLGSGRAALRAAGELRGGGYGREGRVGGTVVGPVTSQRLGVAPKQTGSIDRDGVAKVISQHLSEVQRCYEASLLLEGSDGGRLAVEWTISPAGAVIHARVASTTLKQASVPQCVLRALRSWTFPKARGGNVVISYPFVFQSSAYR